MFFISGSRSEYIDHGYILPLTCSNCKQVSYWKMFQKKSSTTIYFIPVDSTNHGHMLSCDICGFSIDLNPQQVQNAHWLKQVTQAFFNKQISDEEYKMRLEQVKYLH